jgi:hypothetical protein
LHCGRRNCSVDRVAYLVESMDQKHKSLSSLLSPLLCFSYSSTFQRCNSLCVRCITHPIQPPFLPLISSKRQTQKKEADCAHLLRKPSLQAPLFSSVSRRYHNALISFFFLLLSPGTRVVCYTSTQSAQTPTKVPAFEPHLHFACHGKARLDSRRGRLVL